MATQKYDRTVSADDAGFNYEMKMTAVIALRLYNLSDEFYLASNFEQGEKFDDIVFSANMNSAWGVWFVQLKHKQRSSLASKKVTLVSLNSTTKGNKSDYNLVKYFDSYKIIARKFGADKNDVIFGRNYDNARFILYTNAHVHDDVSNKGFQNVSASFLKTSQKSTIFQFDAKKDGDIFRQVKEKVFLTDFLKKFYLYCDQACEDECDAILDKEIEKAASYLSSSEVKFVRGQMYDFIRRWYKTGDYLTKDKVKLLLSKTSIESQSGKTTTPVVTFLPSFLQQTKSAWKNDRFVFLACKDDKTTLCLALLRQLQLLNEPNQYVSLSQLTRDDFKDHLLTIFKERNNITLFIDEDIGSHSAKVEVAENFLSILSKSNSNNKIVIIAPAVSEITLKLAIAIGAKKRSFNCTLLNLTNEARSDIVERSVLYQGYETPLSAILPPNKALDTVFQMNAISELLSGKKLSVGIMPIEPIPYYVPRQLTRKLLSFDIFQLVTTGACIAVSRITFDSAVKMLSGYTDSIMTSTDYLKAPAGDPKILVLDGPSPRSDYFETSKTISNLLWLERSGKEWSLRELCPGVYNYINYLTDSVEYVRTDDITKIREKVVLVSAEPGMGKSTLLHHMAAETKRRQPSAWVVLVTLNDFAHKMDSPDFITNIENNVKSIVAEAAGVSSQTSKFDARLFDYCYGKIGEMIVLLDGFDEITPHYLSQGLGIIHALKKSAVQRIWVSTRPTMRDVLQKELNVLAYKIKPFEVQDQKLFLQKFWQKITTGMDEKVVSECIERILLLIGQTFGGDLEKFAGIPLQTRMVAELFETNIRNFHKSGIFNVPDKIDCIQLFEEFVEKKLNVLDEKARMLTSNATSRDNRDLIRKERENRLVKLALLTLLKAEELATLQPRILPYEILMLKEEIINGVERSGIIVSFKNEVPQFIHRTFAEYFVARFLECHWSDNIDFLTSSNFLSPSFNFVRYLFDRLVTKGCTVHNSVLDYNLENLENLDAVSNVNELDKIGRSALHLAAALPNSEKMIDLLLRAGANPNLKNGVQNMTALEIAVKLGDIRNIAPLITCENITSLPLDVIPLDLHSFQVAFIGDYVPFFNALLDRGIVGVVGVDVLPPYSWTNESVIEGFTYLHLAAAFNACSILDYLLRNNIRDSKLWLLERKTPNGMTPLLIAAESGSAEAMSVLLKAGAEIMVETSCKENVVDLAMRSQNETIFKLALGEIKNQKLDPFAFLSNALTGLVASKTMWSNSALLLTLSLYPELKNCLAKREVPLIAFAISKGNAVAVSLLLELGVDVNLKTRSSTLLHMAVTEGTQEVIEILLSRPDIIIDAVDSNGLTVLQIAINQGDLPTIEKLLQKGGALSCDLAMISNLLNIGVDFTKRNIEGISILDIMKAAGHITAVSYLEGVYKPVASEPVLSDCGTSDMKQTNKAHESPTSQKTQQSPSAPSEGGKNKKAKMINENTLQPQNQKKKPKNKKKKGATTVQSSVPKDQFGDLRSLLSSLNLQEGAAEKLFAFYKNTPQQPAQSTMKPKSQKQRPKPLSVKKENGMSKDNNVVTPNPAKPKKSVDNTKNSTSVSVGNVTNPNKPNPKKQINDTKNSAASGQGSKPSPGNKKCAPQKKQQTNKPDVEATKSK